MQPGYTERPNWSKNRDRRDGPQRPVIGSAIGDDSAASTGSMTSQPRSSGTVREWHVQEGWAVIDSPQTPGGSWTHFSHVRVAGYLALRPGQVVNLDWEHADQDGCNCCTTRAWPMDTEPVVAIGDHGDRQVPAAAESRIVFDHDQT